jgi:hypothetical protein
MTTEKTTIAQKSVIEQNMEVALAYINPLALPFKGICQLAYHIFGFL